MFIYSIRAGTLKLFGFIALALVLTLGVVLFGTEGAAVSAGTDGGIDYSGIKTNEDRVRFIESLGIKVEDTPIEEEAFAIPENFDRIILGYNELQKKQGLDLSKYAKNDYVYENVLPHYHLVNHPQNPYEQYPVLNHLYK